MALRGNNFYSVLSLFSIVCFSPYLWSSGQVFKQQAFGSLNLTSIPQSDVNTLKQISGLYCVDANFDSAIGFFEKQPNFLRTSGRILGELKTRDYFMQATHVGSPSTLTETDSAILIVVEKTLTEYEICYRSFAHLGIRNSLRKADPIISWISIGTIRFNKTSSTHQFSSYGCKEVIAAPSVTQVVTLLSLRHPPMDSAQQVIEFHYDTAWIEWTGRFLSICWEDNPALNKTHKAVTIQALSVQPSSNATNGYVAGITNFSWPAGKNVKGVCIDIPYGSRLPAVPVAFATVNMQNDERNNSFSTWVDSAGVDGLRACVAESFWAIGSRIAGTPTFINYLAVTNPIPQQNGPSLEVFGTLRYRGLSYWRIPYRAILDLNFKILLRNYLSEVSGIPGENIRFVDTSNLYSEQTFFFTLQHAPKADPTFANALSKLTAKFGSTFQRMAFPTNTSSAEYKFINKYTYRSYWSRPILRTNFTFGKACESAPVAYQPCSTLTCGTPGIQPVAVSGSSDVTSCAPYVFNQRCNMAPCISKSNTYAMRVGFNQRLFRSGSSVLWIIIGVVVGLIVVISAAVVGVMYFKRSKKGAMWGKEKNSKATQAVVLGKGLLSVKQ